jgi:hypothetical protein
MNRRKMLKTVALAGAAATIPARLLGQLPAKRRPVPTILPYLASLARPDGGYAWEDQEESHLTPTFAVIGCYHAMKQPPPNKRKLAEFVRTHHPARLKKLEQEHRVFDFQQIQSLVWLDEDATGFREAVLSWKRPVAYLKQYEQHGYPVFQSEMAAFIGRQLLGLPPDDLTPHFTDYLDVRRRANGSFNNTPATDGSDGHVLNTWWGLQALRVLERAGERNAETIAWLRACQLPGGGFTLAPKPEFGGVDDAAYTWAAVRALTLLGATPANPEACLAFLHLLANADGSFSDRPGWLSNPIATYYVLDALNALDALSNLPARKSQIVNRKSPLPAKLKVFSIQIEAPGQGSPSDAVDLARVLRIHLWGAKNAKPEWLARAQSFADRRRIPVKFFVANEEYGTWVHVPGLGTYSHTSDVIAPAGTAFGASLANQAVVSWPEFRKQRLAPLVKAGGRLIWQFGENEELVRMYLDDSLARGGYAAISTFHFGNPDFTNTEPFLHRWRGQIPWVALQDAHGNEPWWWSDNLAGFRTVFLATEPTWEGWLHALKQNWVVAIRHDAASSFKTWMHGGAREVLDFVRARERDWRWWDDPEITRPLVTPAILRPGDRFETGCPNEGVALRLRCWWECTAQGLPRKKLVELVHVSLDDARLETKAVETKTERGALADHYHVAHLPQLSPGKHRVAVTVRKLETGEEVSKTFELTA